MQGKWMKKEDEMVFYTSLSISNIFLVVLTIWLEYPYSLSYHATTLTRLESAMTVVRLPSTIPPHFDPIISDDTMGSVVYSRDEEILSWKALFISSLVAFFSSSRTRSTRDPSDTGTRRALPFSFPSRDGITRPIAEAAPVLVGTIFIAQALPRRSLMPFLWDTSRVTWSFV